MNKYNVTILDKDTMIERTIVVEDTSPMHAHKTVMFDDINSYETESIVKITDDSGTLLYSPEIGFQVANQTD